MISHETILRQMEQLVTQAKHAPNEQQMREQLTAIRALCDVVLVNEAQVQPRQAASMPTVGGPISPSVKLQEDDANGDSIFDF